MNTHEQTASSALVDVARSWVHIEAPEEEINPRDLARWLAHWRSDAAQTLGDAVPAERGPFSALVEEALAVDGQCSPLEFIEWFILWRERAIAEIEKGRRGRDIAGIPLYSALSLLAFQFEDDLSEEALAAARVAMDEIEKEGFSADGCAGPRAILKGLLRAVETLPPRPDVITRVYCDLIVDTIREKLAEHVRLMQA